MSADYQQQVADAAMTVASKVMPMTELPENLAEAYQDLVSQLTADEGQLFLSAWAALPASAQKILSQAEFHGFFIAQAWLKLAMAGQQIAELQNRDDEIAEREFQGMFSELIFDALKESLKKIKKARTDRILFNSLQDVLNK